MIDWRLANRIAGAVASTTPAPPYTDVATHVKEFAARSAELVSEYTRLASPTELPEPETVDRAEWSRINLESMGKVLEPVVAKQAAGLGVLQGITGSMLAAEVGALSGLLSTRVLGQYEFPVTDPNAPARLLFVGPNLAGAAKNLRADDQALTRWVALHETTHALQFAGVPWLRSHMAERIEGLVGTLDMQIEWRKLAKVPKLDDVKAFAQRVREDGLITFVASGERKDLLDEMQATMALIEGHAEHVMDAVGRELLPELDELRKGLEKRRKERSGMFRIFERLIGLDVKLRQYEQGKKFVDAVVAEGGIAALNRAWDGPECLPTLAELDDPHAWIARCAVNAA